MEEEDRRNTGTGAKAKEERRQIGSAATGRCANARSVGGQTRATWSEGIRDFRSALYFRYDRAVAQGHAGADRRIAAGQAQAQGHQGLAFWDNGLKSFSANQPLRTPADFHDLKLRIQSSKVLESQTRVLGAFPLITAFSDIYQALQTGIVDRTKNPHFNFYTQRMYEVQKHMTLTRHGYLGYVVITNKRFWDGLPSGIRNLLEQAMKDAIIYANQIVQEENANALAKIRETGKTQIYTPTPDERAEFKKALLKVHQKMASHISREIIEAIYRETGFNPDKM
jgi:C4-dicarboxylate-binding protein DctP